MKYQSFFLTTVLAILFSGTVKGDCFDLFSDASIAWDIGIGYRQDRLSWDFPGFSPGESIHEKWNDINIGFIETNGKACFCENYQLKFDFDYGWSGSEKNHHAKLVDYNSDITTHRPKTNTKAEVYDISLGLGYEYCMDGYGYPVIVTPLIGWAFSHQSFKNPNFYSNRHERSNYSWNTGWLGFDLEYQLSCPWLIYLDYEFHYGNFHAKIDEFFRDRSHSKLCLGNEVEIGTSYQKCAWLYALKFNYKNYWATKNRSVNGTFNGRNHRKRVQWNSYSFALDLGYNF